MPPSDCKYQVLICLCFSKITLQIYILYMRSMNLKVETERNKNLCNSYYKEGDVAVTFTCGI
jgi:hypothetical protein